MSEVVLTSCARCHKEISLTNKVSINTQMSVRVDIDHNMPYRQYHCRTGNVDHTNLCTDCYFGYKKLFSDYLEGK